MPNTENSRYLPKRKAAIQALQKMRIEGTDEEDQIDNKRIKTENTPDEKSSLLKLESIASNHRKYIEQQNIQYAYLLGEIQKNLEILNQVLHLRRKQERSFFKQMSAQLYELQQSNSIGRPASSKSINLEAQDDSSALSPKSIVTSAKALISSSLSIFESEDNLGKQEIAQAYSMNQDKPTHIKKRWKKTYEDSELGINPHKEI